MIDEDEEDTGVIKDMAEKVRQAARDAGDQLDETTKEMLRRYLDSEPPG